MDINYSLNMGEVMGKSFVIFSLKANTVVSTCEFCIVTEAPELPLQATTPEIIKDFFHDSDIHSKYTQTLYNLKFKEALIYFLRKT